jgi:hypothetical protein
VRVTPEHVKPGCDDLWRTSPFERARSTGVNRGYVPNRVFRMNASKRPGRYRMYFSRSLARLQICVSSPVCPAVAEYFEGLDAPRLSHSVGTNVRA